MRWGWNGGTDAVVVVVMDSSASRQGVHTACKRTKSAASSCRRSEMSASRSIGRPAHRDGVKMKVAAGDIHRCMGGVEGGGRETIQLGLGDDDPRSLWQPGLASD
jgi:hypothetical protein